MTSATPPNPVTSATPRTPVTPALSRRLASNLVGSLAGGLGIVDVRDVAAIAERALSGGRAGERYLLVGANLTYPEVLRLISRHSGRPVHPFRVPGLVFTAAGIGLETLSLMTRRRPLITRSYGALSAWTTFYDNRKSRRDFDHSYVPIDATIKDACRYFEDHHLGRT